MEIHHTKKLPLRLEDWLRWFIFVFLSVAAIAAMRSVGTFLFGLMFLIIIVVLGVIPLYLRWKKLQPLEYLITNERLIIFNTKQDRIERSFDFIQFPEIHLHESAYNSGYIIIGLAQPPFMRGGLFGTRVGVNLVDHEIVLENIPEVRKTYNYLKAKIDQHP